MNRDQQMAQICLQLMQNNMTFTGKELGAIVEVTNWLNEKARSEGTGPSLVEDAS